MTLVKNDIFPSPLCWAVTGGAGFIGSHLVRELVQRGHRVTVLDDLSNGTLDNLREVQDKIRFIQADVCHLNDVCSALQGADIVLHEAAQVSVANSVRNPQHTYQINVNGTENVLEAARLCGVKKVVFASSSAVYGNGTDLPYAETAPLDFQSPYALSKYLGEKLCRHYTEVFGLPTVIVRRFNVFGPGQNPQAAYAAVIAAFLQAARENRPLSIYGDGTQQRDFVFVEDVVTANLLVAAHGKNGEVYNVSGGKAYSLLELADSLEKITGKKLERQFGPARPGDVPLSAANLTKIKEIGFLPTVSLEEGLRRLWQVK